MLEQDYIPDSVQMYPNDYQQLSLDIAPSSNITKVEPPAAVIDYTPPKVMSRPKKLSKAQIRVERKEHAQDLADEGYTRAEIADALGISEPTVARMHLTYKRG